MIPEFLQPFLWSYDIQKLDLQRDKKRIITNILNFGTKKATDWLFETYSKEEILGCLQHPLQGEWNKKSLLFWSFLFDVPLSNAYEHQRVIA